MNDGNAELESYSVQIAPAAWRQLMNLDEKMQGRVDDAIYALSSEPRPSGCKKLRGQQNTYRVRVGNFRVIYDIEDDVLKILVVEIGNRRDVYA